MGAFETLERTLVYVNSLSNLSLAQYSSAHCRSDFDDSSTTARSGACCWSHDSGPTATQGGRPQACRVFLRSFAALISSFVASRRPDGSAVSGSRMTKSFESTCFTISPR